MTTSSIRHRGLFSAVLAGLAVGGSTLEYPYYNVRTTEDPPAPGRLRARAWRELTGGAKRQGTRLARQKAAGQLDFSASERCIERIKARIGGSSK